jgi:hypothetical protein
MATYTPAALIQVVAITTTSTNAGFKYSAPSATTGIIRTIQFNAVGTNAFHVSLGADGTATRIFSATAVAANVPAIYNGWWVTSANSADAINIMATTTSATPMTGQVSGYTYA